MTTRIVEGKKPYTGGTAIEIDENKVISLRLRDENNLIIYDAGDNEIYVDLQLPDGIRPLDAFPVGVTTGRVLVADDWDKTGTIICAKTTSGDNIKVLYADDGTLWIDNGTGTFKQIYFKADVDLIIQAIQNQIDALSGLGKFLSLWDGETGMPISFPLSTPYEYHTGDWYMINVVDNTTNYRPNGTEFDGTASSTVETQATEIGDVYIYDGSTWLLQKNGGGGGSAVLFSQVLGDPYSNTNLATALNAKQDELTAGTNIQISNNVISATGGSDIVYATQAEYNALLPGALTDGKHYFIYTESGGGWQPGANTVLYIPFSGNYNDQMGNTMTLVQGSGPTYSTTTAGEQYGIMPKDNSRITTSLTNLDINSWTVSVRLNWQEYYTYSSAAVVWGFGVGANGKGTGLLFGSEGSREMIIFVWGGDIHTGQYMPQSTWTHICMTQGSGTTTIYMNGQSIYTTSHTYVKNNDVFGIINNPIGFSDEYVGGIDEFIVEDVPRTATEILDYYNNTKANYGIS